MPEVTCRFCLTYNRLDRVFCLRCRRRLLPYTKNGLSADDFTSPGDRSNLEVLRETEPIPHLIESFVSSGRERSEAWLTRHGVKVSPQSRLDILIRACGEILGLERLPRVYVAAVNQVNAFTAGSDDDPLLVICHPTLNKLAYMEMEGLVAHELAHVRSKHVLYHTLAETVATGVQFVAPSIGTALPTLPIRMLLLSWYRDSENSADRAALLVLGDYHAFESLMTSLMRYNASAVSSGDSLAELLQTHPTFEHRLSLAREYYGSNEFNRARAKVNLAGASGSLASICRYCNVMMPRLEAFCPNCGRSGT